VAYKALAKRRWQMRLIASTSGALRQMHQKMNILKSGANPAEYRFLASRNVPTVNAPLVNSGGMHGRIDEQIVEVA
jgi:hypothetical protein